MKKRILSMVLAVILLATLVPLQSFAAESEVTRIQWLQKLTETFDMTVEEDNYPDNYYSDISTSDSYYRDVMVATEFGLIDQEPGTALNPNEPATREFAAHTLNFCLGYELEEGAAYSFSDAESMTYAADAQIAVNRSWFALVDGKFMPEQAVTNGEMTVMLADAASVLAGRNVDTGAESTYTFADGVKEIPEGTDVALSEDGSSLTVTGYAETLSAGDIIAVHGIFPTIYSVTAAAAADDAQTLTVTKLDADEYILSMDTQGSVDADLTDVEAADGTTVTYLFSNGVETTSAVRAKALLKANSVKIKDVKLDRTIYGSSGVKVSVYGSLSKMSIDYKATLGKWLANPYAMVKLNGVATVGCSASFDAVESAGLPSSVPLAYISVAGVGQISVTAKISVGGEVSLSYKANFAAGFEYSSAGGFSMIKNFSAGSFSLQAQVNIKCGIEAKAGLADIPYLKGYVYAEAGSKMNMYYSSVDSDTVKYCIDTSGFIYAAAGYKAKIKNVKTWSDTYEIWNMYNSPLKVHNHFENGVSTNGVCTVGSDCYNMGYGKNGYTTGADSRYYNFGGSNGSSKGLNTAGEPYTIFEYTTDDDGNATITKYYGNVSALFVPKTIDGYTVTAIGNDAFKGRTELVSVVIPSSIVTIGSCAFYSCSNLSSLIIQDGLTTIKERAFAKCISLTTLDLPDTVTVIEGGAFGKCSNLSNVNLSKNLEQMNAHAFFDCDRLTSIEIPKSLTSSSNAYIYEFVYDFQVGAFYGCDGLKNVSFEEGTTTIAGGLFAHCSGLESIVIPDTVTKIGDNAFRDCANLKNIKLSESLTEIGSMAFSYCSSLETIKIPDSVTAIYSGAFGQCSSLSNVELSKNLERLDAHAFFNCDALASIKIPKNLTSSSNAYIYEFAYDFQNGAFYGCDGLKNIEFEEGTTAIPNGLFANCPGLESVDIPDTITKIGQLSFYNDKNLSSVKLSESLTTICHRAFASCVKLEAIEMPDTVVKVESGAFAKCSSLASVKLSKALTQMDAHAFFDCDALTSIEIPKSLTRSDQAYIYEYAYDYQNGPFYNCDGLKTVTFEEGTTVIPAGLFAHCPGIESIVIPDTVTKIGWEAFFKCSNLKTVELNNGLELIDTSAFNSCTSLTAISIPDTVSSMGTYVFESCTSLTTAKLPNIRVRIMAYTFENCTALEKIVLPDTVTEIQAHAFKNCTALKDITWSKSLNTIKDYAFENCDALNEIKLPDSVTNISAGAFYDCDGLTSVSIPNSVTSIGAKLFYDCDALTDVKLGNGITTLTDSMFKHCDVLESVIVPYRVTTIANNAFNECVKLTGITIPRNTTSISTTAFSYPARLTIYGVSGTTAETYAGDIGATFVAIDKPATGVTLSRTELTLNKGQSAKLFVTVEPNDFTDATKWKTSDSAVATIADDGTVKAVGVGTATVSFIAGNTKASCTVTVLQPVTRLSFTKSSYELDGGDTVQLAVNISPEDAANKDIVFSSSDESVATVDQAGLVTALKKGTATITVAAQDGSGCTATCKITVLTNATVCKTVEELQSKHNYDPNSSELWVYTQPGANKLSITFSEETSVEEGSDYIFIYDKDGNELGKYTGTELAGKTIEVEGDTVKIKLTSDEVMCEYGFAVTEIETDKADTPTGDITGDNKVDVTDLIRLKKYIADDTTALAGDADLNGDNKVDILDLIRLKKIIAGETSFS